MKGEFLKGETEYYYMYVPRNRVYLCIYVFIGFECVA